MINDFFRLQNILGPVPQVPNPNQMPLQQPDMMSAQPLPQPSTQQDDLTQILGQLFHPSNVATGQLQQLMNQMPQRQNYEPSMLRKIGGAIAGMGTGRPTGIAGGQPIGFISDIPAGIAANNAITDDPYNKALQDWSMKLKPLGEMATAERASNTNERIAANDIASRLLQERNIKRQEEHDAATNRVAQEKADTSRKRQEAYDFKLRNPQMKPFIDDNGMVVFVDPIDPTKVVHTDVDTGKMNDMEKAQFQIQGKLSEIQAQGSQARQTEAVKETNREKLQPIIQGRQEAVKSTPTSNATIKGTTTAKPETEANKLTRQYKNAQEAYNTHPEWQQYIKLDSPAKGQFKVEIPPASTLRNMGVPLGAKGGDAKMLQDITKFIYKDEPMSIAPNTMNAQPSSAVPDKPKTLTDSKTGHVYDTTTWTDDQIKAAVASGYK